MSGGIERETWREIFPDRGEMICPYVVTGASDAKYSSCQSNENERRQTCSNRRTRTHSAGGDKQKTNQTDEAVQY